MTGSPDSATPVESLFASHYPAIVRFIFRRTSDLQLAEDLAAECYLRALRRAPGVSIDEGWLFGTARNLIGDAYRRRNREQRLIDTLSAVAGHITAEDDALQLDALDGLHARDRELLVMLHIDELTPTDAAAALGVSTSTVWKRGSRARKRLREAMQHRDASPLDMVAS